MKEEMTDHDLLIRIDERTTEMDRKMNEHLRKHWQVNFYFICSLIAAIWSTIVAFVSVKGE